LDEYFDDEDMDLSWFGEIFLHPPLDNSAVPNSSQTVLPATLQNIRCNMKYAEELLLPIERVCN
jgi:hypothetical protein